jgi:hypothetical protein
MKLGLSAVLVLLMGATGFAQGLADMQLFAPVDQSRYGGGYRPDEGYFFTYDGLVWTISNPNSTDIGKNNLTRNVVNVPEGGFPTATLTYPLPITVEHSSMNTGVWGQRLTGGNRYDFGYVSEHHGWLFSGFQLSDYNQRDLRTDASVVFEDQPVGTPIPVIDPTQGPPFVSNITSRLQGYYDDGLTTGGDLPVTFDELIAHNKIETWGLEMNYVYRFHPCDKGGILEFLAGARYFEFDEQFNVEGLGYIPLAGTVSTSILSDSYWNTNADNHMIGPQIGVRWFRRQNRWTWEGAAFFYSGFNFQNIDQYGRVASNLVPTTPLTPGQPLKLTSTVTSETHSAFDHWSPNAELRLNLKYQLTRAVTFRVGWTGIWLNNIARPSNLVDYTFHSDGSIFGILADQNKQDVFINGFTIGVGVNR